MTRLYARAPKGERAYASAPVNKGKNVTIVGALSLEGIVEAMTLEGSTDGQVFSTFIEDVLVPVLELLSRVVYRGLTRRLVRPVSHP